MKYLIYVVVSMVLLSSVAVGVEVSSPYLPSFWDYKTLIHIDRTVQDFVSVQSEEELVYTLGVLTIYEEKMEDDAQASYLIYESKRIVLAGIDSIREQQALKEEELLVIDIEDDPKVELIDPSELEEDQLGDEEVSPDLDEQTEVSSIESLDDIQEESDEQELENEEDQDTDPASSISSDDQEAVDDDEVIVPNTILSNSQPLDAGLTLPEPEEEEEEEEPSDLENIAVQYTLVELYDEFAYTVDWEIPDSCVQYYDGIDAIAKANDFPTSLIIAMRWREHSCNLSNPDNGRGNFQITSHYYEPGEIVWDEFAIQVQNFIDFSNAKWKYYDSIQKFGPEPVALTYDMMDINSIRKHSILYNGVYPDVTLANSWYSNENFSKSRGGRDGIVTIVLKVIQWVQK